MLRPIALLFVIGLLVPPAQARDEWYDYYENALAALQRGDHGAAVTLIEAALERKKRSGYLRTYGNNYIRYVPHFQLGVALHGAGDCAAALASFEESVAREETAELPNLDTRLQRLSAECDERLAPPPVEVAARAEPKPEPIDPPAPQRPPIDRALLEAGLSAYLAGDFPGSTAAFEDLTRRAPDSARLRLLLGMSLHSAWVTGGETDDDLIRRARTELAAASNLDPGLLPDPALCPPPVAALFRSLR
ncbi:MAG: hypothetical protein GTO30_08665 [Acidobacteria bacterium]|nr:hypothetical protein [Acidobacteriota bacterium]NIM61709.1 hypothetical protein [Acidobacteriota bacterium]NIO58191.1 hypothetical protein [Acidobacteriota bacterium]NIQ83756.1 hypothetical protein [Acidobacteriota bacterium]NIT09919.1 hypothetical protein [Acidobacteriota bacterium]